MKVWQFHDDKVLADLSRRIVQRDLFKIEISKEPFHEERIAAVKKYVSDKMDLTEDQIQHFVYSERLTNKAYNITRENINLIDEKWFCCRCF